MSLPPYSRRTVLRAAVGTALAAGAATALTASSSAAAPTSTADEYDQLRDTWRTLTLGTGFSPTAEPFRGRLVELGTSAAEHRTTMKPATGSLWPDLEYADPDPDTDPESYGFSAKITESATRLRTMAEAYCQPGTGLTGDRTLETAILSGLDHLYADVYREDTTRYGNWWDWQIGSPQALLDTCVLMYDQLSQAQLSSYCTAVDHFVPDSAVAEYTGTSTGANRVDLCRSIMLRGVLGGSEAKISLARDALSPVFPYVTEGDGFYSDGSFLQHTHIPYIGGYGGPLNDGLGRLFALLRGSRWEVDDPGRQVFLDTIENATAPFVYNGLMMDNVSGRGISRGVSATDPKKIQQDDHVRAHGTLASMLLVGEGASAEERDRWRAMVKGWLRRDYYSPALQSRQLSVDRLSRLQDLLDDTSVRAAPEPVEHRLFASMDRATHRRPGWAASISMASKRIAHYEFGNGENPRGFHTGSGWLSWWGDTYGGGQYSDAFWPTVDPYRLPGTTVSTRKLADGEGGAWGNPRPDAGWVGGTTDGEYAAVGQHLKGLSSPMQAKKSWFCLDDAVVCLGAGIGTTDDHRVETVIDNRNLGAAGSHPLTVDGEAVPTSLGWSDTFDDAGWAHLAGHAGYVFLEGAKVHALREERTGAWQDINGGGSAEALTRRYLTLWYDHGTAATGGTYAYLLMPGASTSATSARARSVRAQGGGGLTVLANSRDQQGVSVPRLGLTAVNFWEPGTTGPVTASAPAAVLIRERTDGTAVVCVSDPPRGATSLEVVWHRPVREVLTKPATVSAVTTGATLRISFRDLTATAGATQKVKVRIG